MKKLDNMFIAQVEPDDVITHKMFWLALGRAFYFADHEVGKQLKDVPCDRKVYNIFRIENEDGSTPVSLEDRIREIAKLAAGNGEGEPTVNERLILNLCQDILGLNPKPNNPNET